MAMPADPVGLKRLNESRPEVELAEISHEMRALGDGGPIAMTYGSRSNRNYVAYVMRSERWSVHSGTEHVDPGWVVISPRDDPWSDRQPELETESLLIHIAQGGDFVD
ncbi:MAG: hypothetical protein VW060_08445 [Acidimicrobiaceae bacterium]